MDDAAKLGYDLCEAIYAATRVGQGQVGDTKRCEVKPNTVAKLIGALRPGRAIYYLILFSRQVLFFWGVPGSMLSCFSAYCFSALCFSAFCFPASLLVYFSAFLLFCFSAFCFSCFLLFLLLCFTCCFSFLLLCFSAFVLLCLSTSTILPLSFLQSCVLLLYFLIFLLLCFSASCLYYLFVFSFLLLYSLLLVSQMKPYRP